MSFMKYNGQMRKFCIMSQNRTGKAARLGLVIVVIIIIVRGINSSSFPEPEGIALWSLIIVLILYLSSRK